MTLDEFYALPEAEDRIAVYEMEQDWCRFHNGPKSECPDEERDWFPQMSVCQPTMQLKYVERRWEKLHQDEPWHDGLFRFWSKEQTARHPFYYTDGVTFWLSREDLTPDHDFLEQTPPPDPLGPMRSAETGQ